MASYGSYFQAALLHPVSYITVGVLGLMSLVTFNPLPLMLGIGLEVLWLGGAPMVPAFRESVDKKRLRDAEYDEAAARKEQLSALPGPVKDRYARLSATAQSIRENYSKDTQASALFLDQISERVDDVMKRYLKLLTAHHRFGEHLRENDPAAIQGKLQAAERDMQSAEEHVKKVHERKRDILQKQLTKLEKTRKDHEVLEAQLSATEELVRFLSSQAISMTKPEEITEQLDGILSEVEVSEATLNELESSFEDDFDRQLREAENKKLNS